jgi:2-polyprenyl-6-methoxyphenol hydroxylase-like FAD-dependent oxidoreductase
MAMAGGYVLAQEMEKARARGQDHTAAFAAYQAVLKPHVDRKRRESARYANLFVSSRDSWPLLRRLFIKLLFNRLLLKYGMRYFGARSVLTGYP